MTNVQLQPPFLDETVAVHPLLPVSAGIAFFGTLWGLGTLELASPVTNFLISIAVLFATSILWEVYVKLPSEEREDDRYPRSYTRTREFQGYEIRVSVEESGVPQDYSLQINRVVTATAIDGDGNEVETKKSAARAGFLPRTVFDSPVGEGRGDVSAGQQTRELLEDLYDDLLTHHATGAVEETAGVDSALDVVFGGSE